MKRITYLISIIFLSALHSQGQENLDLESWLLDSQNVENPAFWHTNNVTNFVSVTKSAEAISGNFSALVKSNAISWEGPAPGKLFTTWYPTNEPITSLQYSIRVDSLTDGATAVVRVNGYNNGSNIYNDTTVFSSITNGWLIEQIEISSAFQLDSLELHFTAQSVPTPIGYTGFSQFLLDNLSYNQPLNTSKLTSTETSVKVFPNPSSHFLALEIDGQSVHSLQLLSAWGNLIREFEPAARKLDVSVLSSGIYILKIETDRGSISRRVVIE